MQPPSESRAASAIRLPATTESWHSGLRAEKRLEAGSWKLEAGSWKLEAYSYLNASIGSRREAFRAGYIPKKIPTDAENANPRAKDHNGSDTGNPASWFTA